MGGGDGRACEKYDLLIVQSAGNLPCSNPSPFCGVKEHLEADRPYPAYLNEAACRVANPAQSLQALTVGSVAYGAFETEGWQSLASEEAHPSAFSRTGFGIWGIVKPEVVEYGGDNLCTPNQPPDVGTPESARECYPELVRSTMYPPGPAVERDEVGTSFAAPKVAHIAAKIQEVLPDESSLLYRALIVQSARWPGWRADAGESREPAQRASVDRLRRSRFGACNVEHPAPDDVRRIAGQGRRTGAPGEAGGSATSFRSRYLSRCAARRTSSTSSSR